MFGLLIGILVTLLTAFIVLTRIEQRRERMRQTRPSMRIVRLDERLTLERSQDEHDRIWGNPHSRQSN